MNKKLIAVAVAGAFAAPAVAMADGTSVTIYGTLYATYEVAKATGATENTAIALPGLTGLAGLNVVANGNTSPTVQQSITGVNLGRRDRVNAGNSSNIGFRVREDLGQGMAAWAQCESSANLDVNGGALCSRNSGLGLEGAWGNLFLGQWDTPYKVLTTSGKIDPFYATGTAYLGDIIGTPGMGVVASVTNTTVIRTGGTASLAQAAFERRQGNSIQYWTPNWSGFQAKLQYSAAEAATADISTGGVGTFLPGNSPQIKPRVYGLNLVYDNGPLYVGAAYERHKDYFGLNAFDKTAGTVGGAGTATTCNVGVVTATGTTLVAGLSGASQCAGSSSDDKGFKVAASYAFGNFRIGGVYEWLKYDVSGKALAGAGTFASPGALTDFKRNAWAIPLNYDAGNWRVFGAYGQTTDGSCQRIIGLVPTSCSNNDTEAKYWAIGGEYRLSKRTSIIGTYSEIKNSQFGAYTNAVGSLNGNGADGLSPGVGADPQVFAVGFRHTF